MVSVFFYFITGEGKLFFCKKTWVVYNSKLSLQSAIKKKAEVLNKKAQ
jgi:hypothetical protein